MDRVTQELILGILTSPSVLKDNQDTLTSSVIDEVESQLSLVFSRNWIPIFDVEDKSEGLVIENNEIRLKEKWGVELSKKQHPTYIDTPVNIRYASNRILVTNGPTIAVNGTIGCAVLDKNLNLQGLVGSRGTVYANGEYQVASDFNFNEVKKKYYIASSIDHMVQVYDNVTKQRVATIGTGGTAGAPADGSQITNPVAVELGQSSVYVLCNKGTPAGQSPAAVGNGYLLSYDYSETFKSIHLYSGKNSGTGRIFEGEISDPKDMAITQIGGKDHLYILNGTNEIGLFNMVTNELVKIINIPSSIVNSSLVLDRITVDSKNIYITDSATGKVIAIDHQTNELVGTFGRLADESSPESDETLGLFNGLKGIAVVDNTIYVAESINNRVQVFGTELLQNDKFFIKFKPVSPPRQQQLIAITRDLADTAYTDVVIIDLCNNSAEYDIITAMSRKVTRFSVKGVIEPMKFSKNNPSYKIYPVYALIENFV